MPQDELGFLSQSEASPSWSISDLLERSPVLILAPPWTGKSYVAKQFEEHLRRIQDNAPTHLPFGHYFMLVNFEQRGASESVSPSWWDAWREGGDQACLIIDAIDEDCRPLGHRNTYAILRQIEQLDMSQRARLTVLIFCRENERVDDVEKQFKQLYPATAARWQPGLEMVRLAHLTADEAKQVAGSADAFQRVCRLIRENHLEPVAGFPAVISALCDFGNDEPVTTPVVWKRAITRLAAPDERTRNSLRSKFPGIDQEQLMQAAQRVAAVLQFSGKREFSDDVTKSAVSIQDCFPAPDNRLREAAAALKLTGLVTRTGSGYRFCQQHVQERLAAFEMAGLKPAQLRPLLCDHKGRVLAQHRGLCAMLREGAEQTIRNLIGEITHGIPLRSDTTSWLLQDAVDALDRLQQEARASEWPLQIDTNDLSALAAPGLEQVLLERIGDHTLSHNERELLLDVAAATGATDVTGPAEQIIRNTNDADALRVSAAYFFCKHARLDELRHLTSWLADFDTCTERQVTLKTRLVEELYSKGVWDFATAAMALPDTASDAASMLLCRLKSDVTPDRARTLLRQANLTPLIDADGARGGSRGSQQRESPRLAILRACIGSLVAQSPLANDDYTLLMPLALADVYVDVERGGYRWIPAAFEQSATARRMLFEAGLDKYGGDRKGTPVGWRHVLAAEDIDWLHAIIDSRQPVEEWLLEHLLRLAYCPQVNQRERNAVRRYVRQRNPALLENWTHEHRKAQRQHRRWEETQRSKENERKAKTYTLRELVDEAVESHKWGVAHQMWRLASLCFGRHGPRFTNVVGNWDDLPEDLRRRVTLLIRHAMEECDPTPIPDGDAFPSAVVFEADAFAHVIEADAHFALTSSLVEKWLPAVFRTASSSDQASRASFEQARAQAERAFFEEVDRSLRSERGWVTVAENLPDELWSPAMRDKALGYVSTESLNLIGRLSLFRKVGRQEPGLARDLAEKLAVADDSDHDARRRKRVAGIDVLLVADPNRGMLFLRQALADEAVALHEIDALTDRHDRWHVDLDAWSAATLESLAELLHRVYPESSDPEREPGVVYLVDTHEELRSLRWSIAPRLYRRNRPGDHEALQRLAERFESTQKWLAREDAEKRAATILKGPDGIVLAEGYVPVQQVVNLLDNADYRLIRSEDDLLEVLVDEIESIVKTSKHHLAMLYCPPKQGTRQRLFEDALQAYLHCRLDDRLLRRVSKPTTVVLNRETLEAANRKFDVKVQAPKIGGDTATVVIEVKWSDNEDVSTSLASQLGEQYLVQENLTHGIYFVGWNNRPTWKKCAPGHRPTTPYTLPKVREALQDQADRFTRQYPDAVIRVVMADLSWPCPERRLT